MSPPFLFPASFKNQIDMKTSPFHLFTGICEAGWSDFTIGFRDRSWSCNASYIGTHPLGNLLPSAVGMFLFLYEEAIVPAQWKTVVADEEGGIAIISRLHGKQVKVIIYVYASDECGLFPTPEKFPDILPVAEELIDYWDYAHAIFDAAQESIVRQGFAGMSEGWDPGNWGDHEASDAFSLAHFFHLASILKYKRPRQNMTLSDEIKLLEKLLEKSRDLKED